MKTTTLIILFFSILPLHGQKTQVCFTFDDLPVATISFKSNDFKKLVTSKLMTVLSKNKIPAIGFVNERKLYNAGQPDTSQVDILKMWLDNGLDLGNHTFSHSDFNKVSCTEYFNDIFKGEKITRELTKGYGKSLIFFRHPYLHIGNMKEKADSLHTFLDSIGYKEAPVTIDNSDWIFSLAYDSAMVKGDTILMKSIGKTYIDYMELKLKYYVSMSNKLFGYNIKQILLVHANGINADYLEGLVEMYKRNECEFISLSHALEDEAYKTEVTVYRNWGISWLDRWALSMGKKGDFFKDEPATPKWIMELAKVTYE